MNILLCNERFLFRFGVDRALILLGHGLKARGHRVTVMANRFDPPIVESFADQIITVPEGADTYLNSNEFTSHWVREHWADLFGREHTPDAAIIGGWPFFDTIPVLGSLGCATIFMDCGRVPQRGLGAHARTIQDKLAALRQRNLPSLTAITPISRFIARSQSQPESGGVPVTPIALGADHMPLQVWKGDALTGRATDLPGSNAVPFEPASRPPVVLNLGRWEPGCYKNSEAIFEFVDRLRVKIPVFTVAILADPRQVDIPHQYQEHVIPVGFPDDGNLLVMMRRAALGISVSLWEGFNLPLAEMQWLEKPALAFDVAAHPEVVLHPWYLCRDVEEMAARAADVLNGRGPTTDDLRAARRRFRETFRWERVTSDYEDVLRNLTRPPRLRPPRLLIDVTSASRDNANSGVVRVTRRLGRELQRFCEPYFVIWDAASEEYVFPNRQEYALLSTFNGPQLQEDAPRSESGRRLRLSRVGLAEDDPPEWLLLTETIMESNGRNIRRFAAGQDLRLGAIFYDAIPVLRPDLVSDRVIRENHADYMAGLSECDVVFAISGFSAASLRRFWAERALPACDLRTNLLPGEFSGADRQREVPSARPAVVNVLCVSTLEPRKNHANLIAAITRVGERWPGLQWTLTLIGNRYAGSDDIAELVEKACRRDPRIRWLGIVNDAQLHEAYRECAFTVFASELEGFGMPVLESLWHAKPCICHNQGVMAELALGGGCLTTDTTNVEQLAEAIGALANDPDLYTRLAGEAVARPIKTWREYAEQMWQALTGDSSAPDARPAPRDEPSVPVAAARPSMTLPDLLYPACLTTDWQMNDSERLAMMAILHRLKPTCAIEIGTYRGGSLSLLAQYAKAVFSIDIDPSIPEQLKQFENVSFLIGPSARILPLLLKELDAADFPVEFVLIDGDHSAAGVRGDLEILLDYVPKKPLVMLLHDGFNPDCRRGMLEADWSRSPYVQWVDVDFVPGRLIEHGGAGDGEMWGGLAMAYLTPTPRHGPLAVSQTARRAFAEMKERHSA